jgi:cellulose synthase/poly-beta-1,6-N-acetylglucosamine synthase-like glycosyltransferase
MYDYPIPKKNYTVSILIPAYNEEDSIKKTIEAALKSKYKNILEIIAINDGSKDRTAEIVRELERKYKKVKLFDKKNSGKADSINQALKIVKGELVVVLDADSYVCEDAIEKMIGYFDVKSVASVTGRILVYNRKSALEKFQAAEYAIIAFTRKLLEFIDGIWVTPGALSMYRKSALIKVGGFSTKNITEDVEITWRLIKNEYNIRMCLAGGTYTVVPSNFKKWWKQRVRWGIGGLQTLMSYKKLIFKKGALGSFIIPLFAISIFLGLFGLAILFWLFTKRAWQIWQYSQYTFLSNTPIFTSNQLYMSVTVLNFFWAIVFLLGLFITMTGLQTIDPTIKKSPFNLLFYVLFYLSVHPLVMAFSVYKYLKKDITW